MNEAEVRAILDEQIEKMRTQLSAQTWPNIGSPDPDVPMALVEIVVRLRDLRDTVHELAQKLDQVRLLLGRWDG